MMVTYSGHEVCCDDCRAVVAKLRDEGVRVTDLCQPYLPHVHHLIAPLLPEGREAQAAMCALEAGPGPAIAIE